MKNINKVRTERSYGLKFKDELEAFKFLFLYKDLLVPYAEQTVQETKSANERWVKKGFISTREHDLSDWKWLRFGIKIFRYKDEDGLIFRVKMKPEDFKLIIGQFEKQSLRRNVSVYIFKGEI